MLVLILFVIQLCTMIYCIVQKRKKYWARQLVFQAACTCCVFAYYRYYDSLPAPDGMKAPGLYMMSETVTCLLGTMAFVALFVIALLIVMIPWLIRKLSDRTE